MVVLPNVCRALSKIIANRSALKSVRQKLLESFAYLSRFEGVDVRLGLEPLHVLLSRMDSPHLAYPCVIIGGTNGKGSVAAMLFSILSRAGYIVGLYTSPHLFRFNERIRVGADLITDEEIVSLIETIKLHQPEDVTWFEFATAMAFEHFRRRGVDIAVLEVGMGGRLDATNIAPAKICAITNISFDHQEYLGNTLSAIAAEKAGIIKEGGVCVTCERGGESLEVISHRAREVGAEVIGIDDDFSFENNAAGLVWCSPLSEAITGIELPLIGGHQRDNALCAIAMSCCLKRKGFNIAAKDIREGLRRCVWRGRFDILSQRPTIVFDGAHNVAGMRSLVVSLMEKFAGKKIIAVLGFLRGKDYQGMLKTIAPMADKIIITAPDSPRALSPQEILDSCARYHPGMEIAESNHAALQHALSLVSGDDVVCVAGSLFMAAPLEEMFMPRARSR